MFLLLIVLSSTAPKNYVVYSGMSLSLWAYSNTGSVNVLLCRTEAIFDELFAKVAILLNKLSRSL